MEGRREGRWEGVKEEGRKRGKKGAWNRGKKTKRRKVDLMSLNLTII